MGFLFIWLMGDVTNLAGMHNLHLSPDVPFPDPLGVETNHFSLLASCYTLISFTC